MLFKNIGLAITFSPTMNALFVQAIRLSKLFNAELTLIHVGEKNQQIQKQINLLLESTNDCGINTKIVWENGEPAFSISAACEKENVDLLILGALEKENFIKYYVGSVARKLMRSAPCSVMILINPTETATKFRTICASVNFGQTDETLANVAYNLALLEEVNELIFIREFQVPGLSITVTDNGSVEEIDTIKNQWQKEEEQKLDFFISELDLKNVNPKKICLYGKQGWQISKFAKENKSDLLILSASKKKIKLLDRIFQHDLEYIFQDLPCNVLLFKGNN